MHESHSQRHQRQNGSLLDLPWELRREILRELLVHPEAISFTNKITGNWPPDCHTCDLGGARSANKTRRALCAFHASQIIQFRNAQSQEYQLLRNFRLDVGILGTCRQLYKEGVPVLYHDNILKIHAYNNASRILRPMLFPYWDFIPSTIYGSMTNIVLDVEPSCRFANGWGAVHLGVVHEKLFKSKTITINFHPTLTDPGTIDQEIGLIQKTIESLQRYRYNSLRITSNGKPINQIPELANVMETWPALGDLAHKLVLFQTFMDNFNPDMMNFPNIGFEARRAALVPDTSEFTRLRAIIFRTLDDGSAPFNALREACLRSRMT